MSKVDGRTKNGSKSAAARARAALTEYIKKGKAAAQPNEEESEEDLEVVEIIEPVKEPVKEPIKDPYKDLYEALHKDVHNLKSEYEEFKKTSKHVEQKPIIKVISAKQKQDDELRQRLMNSFK